MTHSEAPVQWSQKDDSTGEIWVLRGDTVEEVKKLKKTLKKDKRSASELIEQELGGKQLPGEDTNAPKCQHGSRNFKSGFGQRGKWEAWFCPSPKGTPDQCKPVDARTGQPWG